MNTSSPTVRLLQFAATALGIAIVVLGIAWLRKEPPPPFVLPAPVALTREDPGVTTVSTSLVDVPTPRADPSESVPPETSGPVPQTAVLYGSVRDADGELVKGGVLWLYRDGEHVGTSSLRDGLFVMAGLQPGTHLLKSRIDDQLPIDREVQIEAPRTRLDVQLERRWRMTVHAVTPDGAPLLEAVRKVDPQARWHEGLTALALFEPLAGDLPPSNSSSVSGGLGAFRGRDPFGDKVLPKTAVGVMTVPSDRPVYVARMMRNVLVAQQPASPGQEELTFVIATEALLARTASVRLRLVDESGAPVAGARVAFTDAQTGSSGAPTDAEGRIAFEHLRPGRLDLDIRHKDLCGPRVEIDLAAGADLDLGDVILRPAVLLEFAFDNFGGEGGIRMHWLDAQQRPGWSSDDPYFSAENGPSQKYQVFPGRYVLFAHGKPGVAIVTIDTSTWTGQPLRFELARGAPLRFHGDAGNLPLQVTIATRTGAPVYRREFSGSVDHSLELPVGEYEATIVGADGVVTRRSISLPRSGAVLALP